MKKGLLLSVVASGFIFAGGNIAPVEPVAQPTVAPAACDFWGTLAVRLDANKAGDLNFGDEENNVFTTAIVMGVEKDLGYGFGFGAELAGAKQFDIGIASTKGEFSEISQAYLTYKNGNTAIKVGRQALPKSLSPWAWSDRTAGVLDTSFEGVVVVNTDVADTTLVGAWIARAGSGSDFGHVNGVNNKGLFMLTAQNKSVANTTLTGSVYYVTEAKITSAWASAETKAGMANLGLQLAYAKASGGDATTGVAAYAGTSVNGLNAKLTVSYLKAGDSSLNMGGTSAFWGNSFAGLFGGDILENGSKQVLGRLDLDYKIAGYGTVYGGVGYDKVSDSKTDKYIGGRIGYKFNVGKVAAKVEYRYGKADMTDGSSQKKERIRIEGVYKF